MFYFEVKRGHDGATVSWQSRWPGIDDSQWRYRAVGDSTRTQLIDNLQQMATVFDIAVVQTLQAARIEPELVTSAQMDSVLGSSFSAEQATLLGQLDAGLRNRIHAFALTGLTANTQYEGRAVASGLYFYRLATPEFTQTRKMKVFK